MASREKTQSDFDLERFIEMFDEALTSNDERVISALRNLMMMVILTKPEARDPMSDREIGPLRRMYEDLYAINRRVNNLEDRQRDIDRERVRMDNAPKQWPPQGYTTTLNDYLGQVTMSEEDRKSLNAAIMKVNSPIAPPKKKI